MQFKKTYIDPIIIEKYHADKSWVYNNINSSFNRLYFIESGKGFVEHNQQVFSLEPGSLYLIPCFTPSHYWCEKEMTKYYMHFNCHTEYSVDLFKLIPTHFKVKVEKGDDISSLFIDLIQLRNSTSIHAQLKQQALLFELISFLYDEKQEHKLDLAEFYLEFKSILEYINKFYMQKMDLEHLASKIHLHPTYFSNKFKKAFNLSPIQYLNQTRIQNAQKLIRTTNASLNEIAEQVGFEDMFYFMRVFKKVVGTPPGQYRKEKFNF